MSYACALDKYVCRESSLCHMPVGWRGMYVEIFILVSYACAMEGHVGRESSLGHMPVGWRGMSVEIVILVSYACGMEGHVCGEIHPCVICLWDGWACQ